MKRDLKWRLQHIVHNMVAHPLLVLADIALHTRYHSLALTIQKLHDATIPPDDAYNAQRFEK